VIVLVVVLLSVDVVVIVSMVEAVFVAVTRHRSQHTPS
jgi:hypothetical protein